MDQQKSISQEALLRKERSEKILQKASVPYIAHLPVIGDSKETKLRTKEEIAKRSIALQIVTLNAEDLEQEILLKIIADFGAKDFFSAKEKAFIENNNPSDLDKAQFGWQYECYNVLLWALGYIEKLDYPDKICDVPKISAILKESGSYESFLDKAILRNPEEILDEADLIFRYDWACVNARLKNEKAPGNLNPEVVVERHRALNWLRNYMDQDWDNVSTDT